MSNPIPNFIIIGVQKGGTHSLYGYLTAHPQIFPAARKEIHFFDLHFEKGVDWYLKQFPSIADGNNSIVGEASPYYIFHPCVPQRLFDLFPETKLIVLLRNPVDRAISHYYHNRRKGLENIPLAEAISRESERLNSSTDDRETYYRVTYRHYSYLSRGIYVEQLLRWTSIFPREQLLILKSEDLFAHPSSVLQAVFQFLGVPDYGLEEYFHYRPGNYEPIDDSIRSRLVEYFRPHNQRLERYLGRKFNWESEPENGKARVLDSDRLQAIKQKLERSQSWLLEIKNQQASDRHFPPDLAFITCIEPGMLAVQSLLLYESIRRYGGRLSQYPIYALSPRRDRQISPDCQKRLEQLEVRYIDRDLNTELDFFPVANKSSACAYIEENTSHEILVWLDSDTLILREPRQFWLPEWIDVGVRPIDRKRTCTSGPTDTFDGYWHQLCQYGKVDYDRIPWIQTGVDRAIIKSCYQGGLVVARANKGIFSKWIENLAIGVRQGFDPRIDRKWDNDQPSLSMAIWGTTERVRILEPVYNYPVLSIHRPHQSPRVRTSHPLVHIHYHKMFYTENLAENPLLQPEFTWEEELKNWLLPKIPLDREQGGL